MEVTPVAPVWTEQDYLEFEDSSSVRHEFYGGMVVAMAGASEEHASIGCALSVGRIYRRIAGIASGL